MAKKPSLVEGTSEAEKPRPEPPAPQAPEQTKAETAPLAELFTLDSAASDEQIRGVVDRHLTLVTQQYEAVRGYNVLVLYDGRSIARSDANRIYRSLSDMENSKPILLIVKSPGGDVAAAYFIGKLCREHTDKTFEVAVPREAKSAATLICCGADSIHMGSLSELGPIDPQFGGMPALAVKHSLEHLAEIASRHPGAKEMLSDYLSKSLPVNIVGHFERAAGSAAQYAERLLSSRVNALSAAANAEIARRLVYDYKDHGFAIDAREAKTIFGDSIVQTNSPQYEVANRIYEELDLIEFIVGRRFNRDFDFTGSASAGCGVYARRDAGQST